MTFDPTRVPVGGTVRGVTGRQLTILAGFRPGDQRVRIQTPSGTRGAVSAASLSRDPGRHRAPGEPDAKANAAGVRQAHRGGDDARPGTAPAPPYAGPWSLDRHGNVRVPLPVARELARDLANLDYVERVGDNGSDVEHRARPDDLSGAWPAAAAFLDGAKGLRP